MQPKEIIAKIMRMPAAFLQRTKARTQDQASCTYQNDQPQGNLQTYLQNIDFSVLIGHDEVIIASAHNICKHSFDLLGSDLITIKHGIQCHGLEGYSFPAKKNITVDKNGDWLATRINNANLAESQRIWKLIDGNYTPIDWHLDFKSGYRWKEKTWYRDITFGHIKGVDVKVPWELARMQHLPQLATAYARTKQTEEKEVFAREFRNQVIDFIATNPPRYGVNWVCPMDVAIRVSNWLVAFDLFYASNVHFDTPFLEVFTNSIYTHAKHIEKHLEKQGNIRGNHYLCDITGLLFAAAYVPQTTQTRSWISFCIKELTAEVEYQFYPEGSNFEDSTSYHRLSSETVAFATALACAHRKSNPFPVWYWQRLNAMAYFTMHITKPNGSIHQIGDNDSGRFLKLTPDQVNLLDHKHLIRTINSFFNNDDLEIFAPNPSIEQAVIRAFINSVSIPVVSIQHEPFKQPPQTDWLLHQEIFDMLPESKKRLTVITLPKGVFSEKTSYYSYPAFGLTILRNNKMYLAVRCGKINPQSLGNHAHNDQLSVELTIESKDIFADPGSFLYTPLPDERNRFRSTHAHFTPHPNQDEQASLKQGIFLLPRTINPKTIYFGEKGYIGTYQTKGITAYRIVEISDSSIRIKDYFKRHGFDNILSFAQKPWSNQPFEYFSPAYGIRRVTGQSSNRLLLVAYSFPPVAANRSRRAFNFAKNLPLWGWNPHVLTVRNPAVNEYDYQYAQKDLEGITISRSTNFNFQTHIDKQKGSVSKPPVFKNTTNIFKKFISRAKDYILYPDTRILWLPSAFLTGVRIIKKEKITCIMVIGEPYSSYLIGALLTMVTGVPLVIDFRDEWVGFNEFHFPKRQKLLDRIDRMVEHFVIRKARIVTTSTRGITENFKARYPQLENKFYHLANGFNHEDFEKNQNKKLRQTDKPLTITYCGGVYEGRTLRFFLEALENLIGENSTYAKRIRFVFVGTKDKKEETYFQKPILKDTLEIHGYIPHAEAIEKMRASDYLLCLEENDKRVAYRYVPGKLYEYLGCCVPVIALVSAQGEIAHILNKTSAGVIIPPENVPAIKDFLVKAVWQTESGTESFHMNMDAIGNYSYRNTTRRLATLLNEASQEQRE